MTQRAEARSRFVASTLGGAILLGLVLAIGMRGGWGRSGRNPPGGGTDADVGASGRVGSTPAAAGRFDEAFAAHVRPGASPPSAEELHALGTELLGRDRLVLGWTALETAHRIDPDHAATNRALDELEGKLIASVGAEQAARSEAADEVETLRAVRDASALGLLVLGLARYAGDPGRERDLLDRLELCDRAELRAIETPADAAKLLSRLLMETRRPAEAGDLLRPMADGPGPDREAAWLLSRAALQLGQDRMADAMLERAAGFGRDGASREPAPFVGSRKCAECHPSFYRTAQRSSPHARTIYFGPALKNVPLPAAVVPDPFDPGIRHAFARKSADRIDLETRDERGRVARAVVAYAIGSGDHGITMLSRDVPSGAARELRISYYAIDGSWRATKGVKGAPHGAEELIGIALTDKGLRQCVHCHTTWYRTAVPSPSVPSGPEAADRGIGCERCHGPGLNHVKAVESGYAEVAIAATRDSPPGRLLKSCDECHASNGSVETSDPEFARVQGTTLRFSRCFTGSGGAIHCATCHDPHRGLDTTTARYEAKCLACHAGPAAEGPGHRAPPLCPVNPSSGCIDCHMPKVEDEVLQARFTDHHIRIHRRPATARAAE